MRVSSSSAVRSNAGSVARSSVPSSAGSGMLQCTRSGCDGNSGHTSRTRSHSVITKSKRCADELVEVLGSVGADVDAALAHHPHRVADAAASGGSRRLRASIVPSDICSSSASAICERALFPVHRNKTRRPGAARRRRSGVGAGGSSRSPGCSAPPAACRRLAQREIDRVVAVAPIGRAPTRGDQPAARPPSQVGARTRGSGGRRGSCDRLADRPIVGLELTEEAPGGGAPGGARRKAAALLRRQPEVTTTCTVTPIHESHQYRLMEIPTDRAGVTPVSGGGPGARRGARRWRQRP